jgi:predicted lipoprotein with Yx(FWY)xxD motif
MRLKRILAGAVGMAAVVAIAAQAQMAPPGKQVHFEDYVREPMPLGVQVVATELEGPVFATTEGKTLYFWPLNAVRNGDLGDRRGAPNCDDTRYRVSTGLQSPYPGGLELPEVDTRPSCLDIWPAFWAPEGAREVGKFSIITRKDGRKQWAYDGYALYTSVLDKVKGDVWGGTKRPYGGDARSSGVLRVPVAPQPNIPPQFAINPIDSGRLLVLAAGDRSVYVYDKDTPTRSNCDARCRQEFEPILAPEHVRPVGEWAIIENSPGVKQWTFRGRPLYSRPGDRIPHSLEGGDIPGWHNVWTQTLPAAPPGFTVHANRIGYVLGDEKGRTIYIYSCNDDAQDQQACNHPTNPQVYRLAVSGKGSQERAMQNFPYVVAGANAKSPSHTWSIKHIDTKTGRWTEAGQENALRVWAYRDRPVYLCARDKKPGDIECDSWGENFGLRNGYRAYWLRDDFGGQHG